MHIKLTEKQKEILAKYNIDYNTNIKKELLINIDFVMCDYLDKDDNPTEDFKILEKLYDEIYDAK
ncbi:MAG: hypothetical protein RR353_05005 [Victivallaceae bacterium]